MTELNICCKAGLVVLNSLTFACPKSFFLFPSILNEILAGYTNLGCRFFPFHYFIYICLAIPLWPEEFLLKDQVLNEWGFPCMLLFASPLLLLIFFLCV